MAITNSQFTYDVTMRDAYAEFLDIFESEYNEDKFIEEAYRGMRRYRWYPFGEQKLLTCSDSNGKVQLPCNIHAIEYVATVYATEWSDGAVARITRIKENADPTSDSALVGSEDMYYNTPNDTEYSTSEMPAEPFIRGKEKYVPTGRYLDYELCNDKSHLMVHYPNISVEILYKGLLVDDEDGFPLLTQDAATAVAYYVAFLIKQREVFKEKGDPNLANYFKMEADKWFRLAKTPIAISQNELNDILDQMTRWDRKRYNYSFKPMLNTHR